MDADDLLMKDALEKLYNFAEEYQADVISMSTYFKFNVDVYKPFPKSLNQINFYRIIKPEIESDNIALRIQDFLNFKIWVTPWIKFSKRDLLIEKEILFPEMKNWEDDFWTFHLICEAKKILCIPEGFYIWRQTPISHTRGNFSVSEQINNTMTSLIKGIEFICDLKKKIKFLNDNPQIFYIVVNHFVERFFSEMFNSCAKLQPHEIFQIIFESLGNQSEILAALCTTINTQQKQLYLASQKISELERRLAGN